MKDFIIKYWLETFFGLAVVSFGAAYNCLAKKIHKQKSLREGTQALLRNEIIRSYDKYTEQKWIPIYGRENVLDMYNAYHALGGNGTITHIVEELMELQSKEPEKC